METKAELVVLNEQGIHLASASRIAATAGRFRAAITLRREAVLADAKDLADILQLAAGPGVRLELVARGPDAAAAVAALVELFEARFGES
jgi:phosphotransferase system HPr (HPr) family protein